MATTPKKPQDRKPKKLPVAEFVYDTDFGTVTLPGYLPTGVFRKHRNGSEIDLVFAMIEETADEASLAVVDKLPQQDIEGITGSFEDLVQQFNEHLGLTPGESAAS